MVPRGRAYRYADETRLGGQLCRAGAVTARGTIGATAIATVMDPATGTGHHPASRTRPPPGAAGAPATSRTASKTSRKNLLTFAANSRNCATQKHVSPERITTPVTYASQVAATSTTARGAAGAAPRAWYRPRSRRVDLCSAPRTGIASRPRAGKLKSSLVLPHAEIPGDKGGAVAVAPTWCSSKVQQLHRTASTPADPQKPMTCANDLNCPPCASMVRRRSTAAALLASSTADLSRA